MRLVILESPFAASKTATVAQHVAYAKLCVKDCLSKKESPYVSHLLFTRAGILDDLVPEERTLGILAGHAWIHVAKASVVYTDHGISKGMQQGINIAVHYGISVEYRSLPGYEAPK